ncbi:MAG: DUF3035 domain-containing protein [Rhodobacteraceae bacterium]|jgi:hypothetical protein|uniref:Beta-barrel assembly machine subunit BamF n=1 Tax=Salipiger profundus TaxID=1229727 RepID=A0A1U7CZW6_9RHOB|nr:MULTISPECIES: DUF3035 domain-containing protein [Salipiger]APX21444.1 Beta-barrel assembly machine subunit BamF [Salipiger profundus]MAB08852.1 DUF3035 domain-containing protein [Paracoccaceae bacterium]GGA02337.1 hypothetical protein GCM10011326_12070 [Salipiger profundus]SFC20569.1 Beta-barrel assembly machine subunit BamF [Salipiger profundus]
MKLSHMVLMTGLIGLAACSGDERDIRLHELRSNSGQPEEFAIVPNKPLEQPPSYNALPTPAPGAANRTDQTPKADAVAVLGGNPARLDETAAPRGDAALINRASRYGRQGDIRGQLASEDLAFRKRKSIFNWKLVPEDEYDKAYRAQWLDAYGVLDAFRRAGVRTPSAPPEGWED